MLYLEVLPFVAVPHALTYTTCLDVQVGALVKIRVRNSITYGLVRAVSSVPPSGNFKFLDIEACIHETSVVFEDNIRVIEWVARYYACNLTGVLESALPSLLRQGKPFPKNYVLRVTALPAQFTQRSKQQMAVYSWVQNHPLCTLEDAKKAFPGQSAVFRKLIEKKYIEQLEAPAKICPHLGERQDLSLTAEQQAVTESLLQVMQQKEKQPQLLWGVTGSGKTEVYHRLILEAKRMGQQTLYLVPEIALTEQALMKLQQRLWGNDVRVTVWHCHLSDSEKLRIWQQLIQGQIDVVLGTRSALFLPLKNLGLVIVDEEHEPSYKQSESPRYHGRDLAVYRAHIVQALCVLGSATPSVESWANVKSGKYKMHRMQSRVHGQSLPKVYIADMRYEKPNFEGTFVLSNLLREKINEKLGKHEQILLFLNRRGYSPYLYCPKCEERLMCPHCNANLVFHKQDNSLRCHICDYHIDAHGKCEKCKSKLKLSAGLGTQRVEACLQRFYKNIRVLRMDSDAIKNYPNWYTDVLQGRFDVIIGTQMLAKGLDFPKLTLVGMIQADGQNLQEDFRAAERTFQLIVQVSGRAGRSEIPSDVVLQTFSPHSNCIKYGSKLAVEAFLNQEYALRKQYLFPPFRHIIRHIFRCRSEKILRYFVKQWESFLKQKIDFEILGPDQPTLNKVNGYYRMHMMYLTKNVLTAVDSLQSLRRAFKLPQNMIDLLDVDPVDFR